MGLCQSGEALHLRGIKILAGVGLRDPYRKLLFYERLLPHLRAGNIESHIPCEICAIDTNWSVPRARTETPKESILTYPVLLYRKVILKARRP